MDDVRRDLATAHAAVSAQIRAVPDDGWMAATPCAEWDVAGLVRHLVAGERVFLALLTAGRADRELILPAVAELSPADLPAAYDDASAALRAGYDGPGAMRRSVTLPIGELSAEASAALRTIETLTHGWDLTVALGLPLDVDPALTEEALATARGLRQRVPADRPIFGTPQPVDDGAPALDRLAALLGRTVDRATPA